MKTTKALLLLALLSATSASESSEELNEEVFNEDGRRASPIEECFCLVRHPMMVPVVDYLDSDGHGLSRLVVYLYKDKKTGQMHIYVPGAENQRKFPDISLDLYGNEIFVVNEELKVTSVFEKSKNVISLTVPIKSHQDSKVSQEPTPDGAPALEPEISPHQLLIYDLSNGKIQTHIESSSKTQTEISTQTEPHTHTHPQTHSYIQSQSYTYSHPETYTQTRTQSHYQNHPQSPQNHPQKDINGSSKSSSVGGQFNYIYNAVNLDNKVSDDNLQPSVNPQSTYYGISQYPTPSVVPYGSFPIDSVPPKLVPVATIAVDGGVSINKGLRSSPVPVTPNLTPSLAPSRHVGDLDAISAKRVSAAFDIWFKGQIRKFRDEQLTPHYVLDVKTLKANVEKILKENHIKLTANGKLQDSDGNIMSFSRLKLRPVLIGDSVGYEKVKHRDKFVFPKDLTYLEAILISVSYPPKILGIVPLRKVTLPQISQGTQQKSKTVVPQISQETEQQTKTVIPQISQVTQQKIITVVPQISQEPEQQTKTVLPQISQETEQQTKTIIPQISQESLQQKETVAKSVTTENITPSSANSKTKKKNISHDNTNPKQYQPQRQTPSKKGITKDKKIVETVNKEYNITFAHGSPSPVDLENIFGKPPNKAIKQKSYNKTKKSYNKTKATTEAAVDGRKNFNSDETEIRASNEKGYSNNRDTVDIFKSLLSQTLGRLKKFFPISLPREDAEKEEENSAEDPLGFRIIGGDPATISGKMVDSRGRSGFIN